MSTLLRQIGIKFFLTEESDSSLDRFIPVFHEWIREKRISDTLLIDVADYRHVPNGPGIILVANEAHYAIDSTGGASGLLYSRLRDQARPAKEALADAIKRAAFAANALQNEPRLAESLSFRTDTLEMHVSDRLIAPNSPETRASVEPIFRSVLEELGYQGGDIVLAQDSRSRFALRLSGARESPSLAGLC